MPEKIYFRVFYCNECHNLYTKQGYHKDCENGHNWMFFTLEVTKNKNIQDKINDFLNIKIIPGKKIYNTG